MEKFKVFSDFFYYEIPIGVLLLVVVCIVWIFERMYKTMYSHFKSIFNEYRQSLELKDKRINKLEKVLDKQNKGGTKK